jgi:hypothetical protein
VHTWVDGETATVNEIDAIQAAHDLSAFISALRQVDPTGAPPGRGVPLSALRVDDATWGRARGWVVSQAVAALAYYTPENNPSLYNEAQSWLELVLSE